MTFIVQNQDIRRMHSDIHTKTKSIATVTLPQKGDMREWSNYRSSESKVTVSLGDFTVSILLVRYPYPRLQSLFQVANPSSVTSFMGQHPLLYNSLVEVEAAIRNYFPDETLRLNLYEDPEGEMDNELAIYVLTQKEPYVALDKLDTFDNEFWSGRTDSYKNLITINVEYL